LWQPGLTRDVRGVTKRVAAHSGTTAVPPRRLDGDAGFIPKLEIHMSADKDRGIRRVKQKRAKDAKRAAKAAKSPKPAPAKS